PEAGLELLERIKDNALTTLDLVSNFVEMDRIESGCLIFERAPVRVAELVDKVLRRHKPMAEAKGVAIAVEAVEDVGEAFADRAYLERVIANLVSNAIKFTPAGGRVTVRIAMTSEGVSLSFEDTGCGVPETERERIFDK